MSQQQHLTRKINNYTIAYLPKYLGLNDGPYSIRAEIEDLRCFWYSDYQTVHQSVFFEIGHTRTDFFVNFQIPLDELTQDEIAMLKVRWVCYTDADTIYGSIPFTSDNDTIPQVDFDVEVKGGLIQPIELIFYVDQGWLQIK
jgi:hypothetical protein